MLGEEVVPDANTFFGIDTTLLEGLGPQLATMIESFYTGMTTTEWGTVVALFFLALLLFRAKTLIHLFFWIGLAVVVFIMLAIVGGVINL